MARVLLLEDHPRLAELVRRALVGAGIECDVVSTIDAAMVAQRLQDYAAVLVDRGLPDGDGLTLITRWRRNGCSIPCLILTARDALHDRVEGLEAGADDYLAKPFPMEELVARVRALLRRPAEQRATDPVYGDLHLTPGQSLLVCGDRSTVLSRSELQILQTLLEAGGQAVRRSALEAAAWGLHEAVTPGALDVAMHRLRRRIQSLGSRVQVHNIRGVGFAVGHDAPAPGEAPT